MPTLTPPEEIQTFRGQAKNEKRAFLYRYHRPDNPPTWNNGMPLRFKSEPKKYSWHDAVMGDLSTGPEVIDDFILIDETISFDRRQYLMAMLFRAIAKIRQFTILS